MLVDTVNFDRVRTLGGRNGVALSSRLMDDHRRYPPVPPELEDIEMGDV